MQSKMLVRSQADALTVRKREVEVEHRGLERQHSLRLQSATRYTHFEKEAFPGSVEIISDLEGGAEVGPEDCSLGVHDEQHELSLALAHLEEPCDLGLLGVGGSVSVALVQHLPALLQDIGRDELFELVSRSYLLGHGLGHEV